MALTSIGYGATVTLQDKGANKSVLRYKFNDSVVDFEAAQSAMTALLVALANVTDAAIMGYGISEIFEDAAAGYTGEVSTQAVISVRLVATPVKYGTIKIPAPKDTLFVEAEGPLYNDVDPSDSVLVAYLSLFEAGGTLTTSDGESIMDAGTPINIKGQRIHRASRG
jgi:hypothetical protein